MSSNTSPTTARTVSRSPTAVVALLAVLALALPELSLAQVGGISKSTSVLEQLRDWLWLLIPIVCLITGGILGALYSMDIIRKDTFYTWVGGVVFAGVIAGGVIEVVF